MLGSIKVGEELKDIVVRVEKSKELVDEALALYVNTMNEFKSQYKGKASENVDTFSNSEAIQIKKLSEFYGKTASYVTYVFKQMGFTDKEIAKIIEDEIQSGDGK